MADDTGSIYEDAFFLALPAHLQKRVLEIGDSMNELKALRAAGRKAQAAVLHTRIERDVEDLTAAWGARTRTARAARGERRSAVTRAA